MALPTAFLEELRLRTPLVPLIGRRVRLARSGRHHKGCCPFHGEKSPSFYVYDDHFHCFGCGAHGDAISFVMQSQGESFHDAVAALAAEAGLEVPRPAPGQIEAERKRLDLHALLEAAQAGFRRRLAGSAGAAARDYLARRGVLPITVDQWGLGWSGPGRGDLVGELAGQGITPAMLAEAGLMRLDEAGEPAGELFFNRLTFPIRDARSRIVAFGGRTLGDGVPKYLNGPETALFSKRRTLFGLDLASAAARSGQTVVVVEGYMDVISLHQAGFPGAVAPLGTALTEDQLGLLWRLSPMPVLCFDGDAAGVRATLRAIETALPLLAADRSLKVARLSAQDDPDSFVRRENTGALRTLLDQAPPIDEALFGLLSEGLPRTPEGRAALRTRLESAAAKITDRTLAREMRAALLDRFFQRPPKKGAVRVAHSAVPDAASVQRRRWLTLAGLLLRHPVLGETEREAFTSLAPPPGLEPFAQALAAWHDHAEAMAGSLDSHRLITHLQRLGLADIVARALEAVGRPDAGTPDADPVSPEQAWRHYYSLMHRDRLDDDIARAQAAATSGEPGAWAMLARFAEEKRRLTDGEHGLDTP